MRTYTLDIPRLGTVRIRRNGRVYFATLGEWEILGSVLTLASGLIIATVSTIAESLTK